MLFYIIAVVATAVLTTLGLIPIHNYLLKKSVDKYHELVTPIIEDAWKDGWDQGWTSASTSPLHVLDCYRNIFKD